MNPLTRLKHAWNLFTYEENPKRTERTDWFKVKAERMEVKINLTQAAQKITGEIKDITVEHNVFKDGVKGMKILVDLIEKAHDTMDEVEWYAEKAHLLRMEHKSLADTYIKIAEMHITIYNMLHDKMVMLIEETKSKGVAVPHEMQVIWDYEHEKLIKEFAEAKYLIEEYKKMGY